MSFLARPSGPGVRHAWLTDVGRRREKNEDAVAVFAPSPPDELDFDLAAVVCDGVGGQPRGEMASRIAVDEFRRVLERPSAAPIAARLGVAGAAASAAVEAYAREHAEGAKLATTVVALVLHGGRATVAHAGDSRAYLLRDGALKALTADHSYVAEQVRAGLLAPSEARTHPLRSRLSRAVGVGQSGALDVAELDSRAGDLFLLCTDGLHALVEEREIALAISSDLERSARRLIDLANAAGGVDNVTVALCLVG